MKGNDMDATHDNYHVTAAAIGSILSDLEQVAFIGERDTRGMESGALFAAIQIMANKAEQMANDMELAAEKAMAEVKQ